MELQPSNYRGEVDGKPVDLFLLRNGLGMVVGITNWGARIVQVLLPDRGGSPVDVALGYDTLAATMAGQPSMGAFVGRYANRIAGARFSLHGVEHRLAANSGPNTLHGGEKGSRFQVFEAKRLDEASVELRYTFRDGEEGFPGTLPLRVVYAVSDSNELVIVYDAVSVDRATVCNFTTHGFFNLAGHGSGSIADQVIEVYADRFLPVDANLIPTGELRSVEGTPMDLRTPVAFRDRWDAPDEQMRLGGGLDHHYALIRTGDGLRFAARVTEPVSGRVMEVWTTEPGMQVYSGNMLQGKAPRDVGKGGALYGPRTGFCLEPSRFPDSPNHPSFPSTILRPGEWFHGETVYRFS